jgi:pyruvate,water dikinase
VNSPSLAEARATLVALEAAHAAGGKARGLAHLLALGLDVPPGFAVQDAHAALQVGELDRWLQRLGPGPVAVRSSADVEDGELHSWAGQFLTTLDVEGPGEVLDAIAACVRSGHGAPARAYGDGHAPVNGTARMHVVVQRMVAPRCAGVLFTADPVSGRRDRLVVEAVAGQGEALVSGRARAQRYLADPLGRVVSRELHGEPALLDDARVAELAAAARAAAERLGRPLDLEWALDEDGRAWWLQARPITTLGPDLALDAPAYEDHV